MNDLFEEKMKEKDDFIFIQDGWIVENDVVISRYARENKRKQEKSVSPTASAWISII